MYPRSESRTLPTRPRRTKGAATMRAYRNRGLSSSRLQVKYCGDKNICSSKPANSLHYDKPIQSHNNTNNVKSTNLTARCLYCFSLSSLMMANLTAGARDIIRPGFCLASSSGVRP